MIKQKDGGEKYQQEAIKEQQTLDDVNTFLDNNEGTNVGGTSGSTEVEENKLYLIQNGITTNNFETSNMQIFNINTNSDDYSVVAQTDNIHSNRAVVTFRSVDLTDYSKIGIDYKVTNKTGDTIFSLSIFQAGADINMDAHEKQTILTSQSEYSKERATSYIEDLPSGIRDISIVKNATLSNTMVNYNVYSLWIEKSNGQKEYLIENGVTKKTYELYNVNILNESSTPNVFGLTNAINNRAGIALNNQSITEYSKIGIDYEVENKTGDAMFVLGLFKTDKNFLNDAALEQTVLVEESGTSKVRTINYIENIEAGIYNLFLFKNATGSNTQVKYKIYNLWLEK